MFYFSQYESVEAYAQINDKLRRGDILGCKGKPGELSMHRYCINCCSV